jgi:energy-coupling factor transport system permease protein
VALLAEGDGAPLYALGPLLVTAESLWLAGRLVVVLLSLYALALLLTATTSPVALIEGLTILLGPLRRLGLPIDEFALMALLALRFFPTLAAEIEMLVKAQLARGADFTHGPPRERAEALSALIAPVFQAAWRRAAALATALEARGSALGGRQTLLYETALGREDYVVLVALALVTLGVLML